MAFKIHKQRTPAVQMKTVKAAWDKAPAGPKKDTAYKHYAAAESALKAYDDRACLKALDEAKLALE